MMDALTEQWFYELMEVDDHVRIDPWHLNSVKDYSRTDDVNINPEASQKTSHEHDDDLSSAHSTKIISFDNLDYSLPDHDQEYQHKNLNCATEMNFSNWGSITSLEAPDQFRHKKCVKRYEIISPAPQSVLAERKRRQRLTHLFISLSTIIPGLKKLDKASILAGAIEYLKQLQQRIQVLEEDKEKLRKYDNSGLVSYNYDLQLVDQSSPEVKVRISDGDVLLGIYCRNRPRILNHILSEIEKLHLCIISTNVIPFGNTILHITITAQESSEFCMRAQDVVDAIRGSI